MTKPRRIDPGTSLLGDTIRAEWRTKTTIQTIEGVITEIVGTPSYRVYKAGEETLYTFDALKPPKDMTLYLLKAVPVPQEPLEGL